MRTSGSLLTPLRKLDPSFTHNKYSAGLPVTTVKHQTPDCPGLTCPAYSLPSDHSTNLTSSVIQYEGSTVVLQYVKDQQVCFHIIIYSPTNRGGGWGGGCLSGRALQHHGGQSASCRHSLCCYGRADRITRPPPPLLPSDNRSPNGNLVTVVPG